MGVCVCVPAFVCACACRGDRGPLGHLRCRHGYEHGNPGDVIMCSPRGSIPGVYDSRVARQCVKIK